MRDPDRPPRPGRGLLLRALFACVLTVSLSATAVASAVWLEGHELVEAVNRDGRTIIDVPEVDRLDELMAFEPHGRGDRGGRERDRQHAGDQGAQEHPAARPRWAVRVLHASPPSTARSSPVSPPAGKRFGTSRAKSTSAQR